MLFRSILAALCSATITACQAEPISLNNIKETATSAEEKAIQDAILKRVDTAIQTNDFKALSTMEQEFLAGRERTPSGLWKVGMLHAGLQFYLADGLVAEKGCQYRKADFVAQWAAAEPHSPGPVISHAALLHAQAWCYRGTGTESTVSEDAWKKFYAGLNASEQTLEVNKELASVDPEFYAVRGPNLMGLGASDEAFQAFMSEATSREPAYQRVYANAIHYYKPQWGGSVEKVDAFARYAASMSQKTEGQSFYARIYSGLADCRCHLLEQAADWPTLAHAMRDAYNRYPTAWNRDKYVKMSCRFGQVAEALAYIKAGNPGISKELSLRMLTEACQKATSAT